jgi:hypothetical protein
MRSQSFLGCDHGLDTVVHVLNEFLLGAAEAALVRDVVGAVVGFSVLTMDTADLYVVLISDGLESRHVLGELGKLDVDGGAEGSAEVGGAGGDVAEVLVVGELADSLNVSGGTGEAVEHSVDVSTTLHGDNAELILLIDPDEESLGVVVEDTTARGPVAVEATGLEETVTLPRNEI